LLDRGRAPAGRAAGRHITGTKAYEFAPTQLGVDLAIEQREVAGAT
jgi:hypothetical protein